MDVTALFKLTYGMYILSAKDGGVLNACVVNTFAQVSGEPPRALVTVTKGGLTHDMIDKTGLFCVSILPESTPIRLVASFGFRSGRDADKFAEIQYNLDGNGLPYLTNDSAAAVSCKVFHKVDVGTHTTFFADITDAKKLSDEQPMSYGFYRAIKNGKPPKSSPLSHEV